jgi:hypothetical protein
VEEVVVVIMRIKNKIVSNYGKCEFEYGKFEFGSE